MQQTDSSGRRRAPTTRRRLGIFAAIGTTVAALGVGSFGVLSASAQPVGPAPKVTLCHRTGSQTNPYVEITVSQNAVFNNGTPNGHGTHTGPIFPDTAGNPPKWGDIIPAFDGFPGINDTAQGQAILANGCKIPGPPVTNAPPVTTAPSGPAAPTGAAAQAAPTASAAAAAAVVAVPRTTG